MSNIHWEVATIFEWGTTVKTTYATRALAREGMKISKDSHLINGKPVAYISWKLFKVTQLSGLSTLTKSGVFIYEEAR